MWTSPHSASSDGSDSPVSGEGSDSPVSGEGSDSPDAKNSDTPGADEFASLNQCTRFVNLYSASGNLSLMSTDRCAEERGVAVPICVALFHVWECSTNPRDL